MGFLSVSLRVVLFKAGRSQNFGVLWFDEVGLHWKTCSTFVFDNLF